MSIQMTSGKTAKKLRRMAREEMASNSQSVDRELVIATMRGGHEQVINEPLSVRAMYQNLKMAWHRAVGTPR